MPTRSWGAEQSVADSAIRSVLVMGDIHGDVDAFATALALAKEHRCGALVSVGDFGLVDASWKPLSQFARDRYSRGTETVRRAAAAPLPVVVVDGNHEVWPCLDRLGGDPARPLHLAGSLWWARRGCTWRWGGHRFGALGGAVSPDKRIATVASACWPESEAFGIADVDRLVANAADGVDVLFCHDAPWGARGLRGEPSLFPSAVKAEADALRRLLRAAVDATDAAVVCHGHWHQQNRCSVGDRPTSIIGMGSDGGAGCYAVLDCATLRVAHIQDDSPLL